MGRDRHPDGVRVDSATPADLETYAEAQRQIGQMQAPVLHRQGDAETRLFVMAFDGTGNDMATQPRENWTNVALIHEQARALQKNNPSIGTGYVAGPGTQDNRLSALIDGITGHTFESRMEDGYDQFTQQAALWLKQNPGAVISLAAIGFSRGAEQTAAFTRLVHERGIQDPAGAVFERNAAGEITGVTYTRAPLVAPGEVRQAAVLLDPVGTGEPMKHDRRLAPSVLGALQISAIHEQRDQFKSTEAVEPGLSPDVRFLHVGVAGAHSNIGGSYTANGLSDRSFNLIADYMNSLVETPVITKRAESMDPALNVIHRSHEHQWVYTQRGYRDGVRDVVERLAPEAVCRPEPRACLEREPTDERLANTVEWRPVRTTPNPTLEPTPPPRSPKNEVDALFARLATAAEAGDTAGMREAARRYVQTDDARRWRDEGRAYNASFVDEPAHEPAHRAEPERPPMHELPEATAPVMRR